MRWRIRISAAVLGTVLLAGCGGQGRTDTEKKGQADMRADMWLTTSDERYQLEKMGDDKFQTGARGETFRMTVNPGETYQTMDGFGASFTDASAWLTDKILSPEARKTVMEKLFDKDKGIGLSFLRQPMGASDFTTKIYSYDDQPEGRTDEKLEGFSVDHDKAYILPLLKQAMALNPDLKVMASPWSAPGWMKNTGKMITGTLLPEYHEAFAQYFVRFIQAYAREGVPVYAITPQNEPGYEPVEYPGMVMSATEQATFIRDSLGPAFEKAGIHTKILCFDHNWDNPFFPRTVFTDPAAARYVAGTAWHCYGGSHDAMTAVHDAFPDKEVWFTEASGGSWVKDSFDDQMVHVIRSTRNWSKTVVWWNMALDENNGPTVLKKSTCRGVLKISQSTGEVTFNVDYYTLGQISKFVRTGAVRIASDTVDGKLETVAFRNPDGGMVLIAYNRTPDDCNLEVTCGEKILRRQLPGRSAATFCWKE